MRINDRTGIEAFGKGHATLSGHDIEAGAPPRDAGPPEGERSLPERSTPALIGSGVKTCPRCKEAKPRAAFSRDASRRDGMFRRCRSCKATGKRRWTLKQPIPMGPPADKTRAAWYSVAGPSFPRWLALYKQLRREVGGSCRALSAIRKYVLVLSRGGCCSGCGYSANLMALDFDHTDPTNKAGNVSGIKGFAPAYVEAQKCRVLCANCHRQTFTTPEMERLSVRLNQRVPLEVRGEVA